jgi:hypothetical protein
MSVTGWPSWMLLSAVMAITAAAFLALPAVQSGNRALRHGGVLPAVPFAAAPPVASSIPARVCVTRRGLCPVGPVRAGDPCRCPDPLRGSAPGHVEPVGGPPARATRSRDWPSEEAEDLLFGP